ncbi:alpha/beta fold hydrolase [Antrihabitans sp. NCIMB 15449]|uniref:Alpha/beta fold hydrolase n=1 Tax=Antrihabitans spumae TaxID=3373370 RepID=A0ABW7JPY9_9NOCA
MGSSAMKRSSGWGELGGFGRGLLQRRSSAAHGPSQWTASLPDGQWVELDGGRKAFVRNQSGPPDAVPVLLLHGWRWSMDLNFVDVFPRLADSHSVVALDQRGHGHSPRSASTFDIADLADDAIDVLNALGIRRAVVCGFSLGGIVGLQLALRHPDRVAGLAGAAVRRHDLRGRVAGLRELPTSMLVTSRDTVCLPWLQHQLADQIGARIVELDEDHLAPITHPEQYAAAAIESIRLASL